MYLIWQREMVDICCSTDGIIVGKQDIVRCYTNKAYTLLESTIMYVTIHYQTDGPLGFSKFVILRTLRSALISEQALFDKNPYGPIVVDVLDYILQGDSRGLKDKYHCLIGKEILVI